MTVGAGGVGAGVGLETGVGVALGEDGAVDEGVSVGVVGVASPESSTVGIGVPVGCSVAALGLVAVAPPSLGLASPLHATNKAAESTGRTKMAICLDSNARI